MVLRSRCSVSPLAFPLLLALTACSEKAVGIFNTPPSASIISPAAGDQFAGDTLVELRGLARDSQDDSELLLVSWSSSIDGELGVDPPNSNGDVYLGVSALTEGEHVITLTVVDTSGDSASDAVNLIIGAGAEDTGGGDDGPTSEPPTVLLAGPSNGDTFGVGETVTFIGKVSDDQAPETLGASLVSTLDGVIWTGNPAADGRVDVDIAALNPGAHTVSLEVTDDEGNTASDQVDVTVLEDGRPVTEILSPLPAGNPYWTDSSVTFQGVVSDGETDAELLGVTWSTDLQGTLATGAPDSAGNTATSAFLVEGTHVVTLTAVDSEGKVGTATSVIEVYDPLHYDNDGDGFSESEGDCDDADATRSPGIAELCDDVDNDCDGEINEDWWDTKEADDSIADPYDLGGVGSGLWSSDTVTISGLSLHEEGDEDWFVWEANDIFLVDNVTVQVSVTGLPSAGPGDFVVELYLDDGGYNLVDSDSGLGTLSINHSGDVFEGGEDNWAIRIYAANWPAGFCTSTFTIKVTS